MLVTSLTQIRTSKHLFDICIINTMILSTHTDMKSHVLFNTCLSLTDIDMYKCVTLHTVLSLTHIYLTVTNTNRSVKILSTMSYYECIPQ